MPYVIARDDGEFFETWQAHRSCCYCPGDCDEHYVGRPTGFTWPPTRHRAHVFESRKAAEKTLAAMYEVRRVAIVELVDTDQTFEETWRPSMQPCCMGMAPKHDVWERGPEQYAPDPVPDDGYSRLLLSDPLRPTPIREYHCRTCGRQWEPTVHTSSP